jgi:transposase
MTVSASTVLRSLHQMKAPPVEEPRIIGIDDWAFRKGKDYGTIIVDHETGRPLDLLPERDTETVRAWLEAHPTVEIVTRDRSGEYREAINQSLPDAVQIADRWHLLKDLEEAIQRHISRRYQSIRQLVAEAVETEGFEEVDLNITEKHRRYHPGPGREDLHIARTEEREALFAAVKVQYAAGAYTTDLAQAFNLSRKTISHWVNSDALPPDTRGRFKRESLIDEYLPYLRQRIEAGCINRSQLWREISGQGFNGSRTLVGKWIRQNYATKDNATEKLSGKKTEVAIPSSRKLAWLMIRRSDELEADEKRVVELLLQDAKLAELRELTHEFMHMVRNSSSEKWSSWLERCCESAIKELRNFAIGLHTGSHES